MPATSTHKHPDGRVITFTEADHLYRDDRGRRYTSVTTWLKKFFPPFNAEGMAANIARRDGREVEDILAEWAAKRDAACAFGTRTHEIAEAVLLGEPAPHQPRDEREARAFFLARDYALALRTWTADNGGRLYVERVVADPDYLLAGTIDLQITFSDCTWLIDWKTNADLQKSYGRGFAPVDHLPDSNKNKYALQLSTYERILRRCYDVTGPVYRRLVHLDHAGERHFIDLACYADEIEAMLQIASPANA